MSYDWKVAMSTKTTTEQVHDTTAQNATNNHIRHSTDISSFGIEGDLRISRVGLRRMGNLMDRGRRRVFRRS